MDIATFGAVMAQIRNGITDGSVTIVACQAFPDAFTTNDTTLALCQSVTGYADAHAGIIYTGAVQLADGPFEGNAECRIWTIASSMGGYILSLELMSATEAPYRWTGVYWNGSFTGWAGAVTQAEAAELNAAAQSASETHERMANYDVAHDMLYTLLQARIRQQQEEIDELRTAVAALA